VLFLHVQTGYTLSFDFVVCCALHEFTVAVKAHKQHGYKDSHDRNPLMSLYATSI
jgi:hypothetical protein